MVAIMETRGRRIDDVLCPDGKRRRFTATGDADSSFSIPGYVQSSRVKVSGFITAGDEGGLVFFANQFRKNGWVFWQQTLVPGAIVQQMMGDEVLTGYRVSHWYWDERPYWRGPSRYQVVLSVEYLHPDATRSADEITEDGTLGFERHDPENIIRAVRYGTYRVIPPMAGGMLLPLGPVRYGR